MIKDIRVKNLIVQLRKKLFKLKSREEFHYTDYRKPFNELKSFCLHTANMPRYPRERSSKVIDKTLSSTVASSSGDI